MRKQLKLKMDGDCVVPTSHKLNQDGYFRYSISKKVKIMFHRLVWEKTHGTIPDGFEIHHTCHNRACCNIKHLECIESNIHTVLTNKERYADRHARAFVYWRKHAVSGAKLGKVFGVSFSIACRWIREWKV